MAGFIGATVGDAAIMFLLLVIVLAVGKVPGLRHYALAVHIAALALALAIGVFNAQSATAAPAAYVVTLIAIWDYRRDLKRPPSGWHRLGAASSVAWLLVGVMLLSSFEPFDPSDTSAIAAAWIFAAIGIFPWLLGWAVAWVRRGFQAERA